MDGGAIDSSDEMTNHHGAKRLAVSDSAREKLMTVHSKDGKQQATKLERIGKLAETKKDLVFNNLGHVVDLDLLRESYRQLDGNKAVGIDGVSKEYYGKHLEGNLQDLLNRIRKGAYKPQPASIVEIPKEDGSTATGNTLF